MNDNDIHYNPATIALLTEFLAWLGTTGRIENCELPSGTKIYGPAMHLSSELIKEFMDRTPLTESAIVHILADVSQIVIEQEYQNWPLTAQFDTIAHAVSGVDYVR